MLHCSNRRLGGSGPLENFDRALDRPELAVRKPLEAEGQARCGCTLALQLVAAAVC
jgi:hypothetical protein